MARRLLRPAVLVSYALASGAVPAASQPAAAPAEKRAPKAPSRKARHEAVLHAHNQRRAKHCAPPLRWSEALARGAQSWADELAKGGCKLRHSRTRFGENLAAGTTGAFSPAAIVEMWYREIDRYRFASGGFSLQTGHFTQLVWRATREVGCGVSRCKELEVWVCNYDPPGNVEGQYEQQVLPVSCRK